MTQNLTYNETMVLGVIEDYLNENRTLNLEKVVPFIQNHFSRQSINLNKNGIKIILKSLVEKSIVVQGSKLLRANLLQNENRKQIFDYIVTNPGSYFHKIVKKLELSNHVVAWHINILLKFKCIYSKIIEDQEVYFASKFSSLDEKVYSLLSKAKPKQIIDYFRELNNEAMTKTFLSKELGIHYNTVTKYCKQLEECNILQRKKLSNKTLYFLNQKYF